MQTLFLMVARGGSRGVKRKNLRPIGGRSLIEWKARGALRSAHCERIIMSSEDAEILEEARRVGCETPFIRPTALASDTASSAEVIRHALDWLERHGERYESVMLLEPSAPFTRASDYDAAIELYRSREASLVVGMKTVEVASTFIAPFGADQRIGEIVRRIVAMPGTRRQDQAPEATMNAALYLFSVEEFRATGRIYSDPEKSYGYLMPPEYSVEVDSPIDLAWAEFLVGRGDVRQADWD